MSLGYWCDKCRRADRWTELRRNGQTLCDFCSERDRPTPADPAACELPGETSETTETGSAA